MFFSYGNTEPRETGYTEVQGFTKYHVNSTKRADAFTKQALKLMHEGFT
jgi:hypothetical protein